jgi:hypothetical protein
MELSPDQQAYVDGKVKQGLLAYQRCYYAQPSLSRLIFNPPIPDAFDALLRPVMDELQLQIVDMDLRRHILFEEYRTLTNSKTYESDHWHVFR